MSAGPLLEVHELTVRHGGLVALDAVSFRVEEGTVAGLIGPNGAGKTTCIDCLTGFTPAASGHIVFAGQQVEGWPPHSRARAGFVRTFQSLELFDDLTVRENLSVASEVPTWRSTLTDVLRTKRPARAATDEVLGVLGLDDRAEVHPSSLSNGERHLVALGRALASRPRLLLLDEPTAGLASHETEAFAELLHRLRERGTTVVLVDHDMSLVLGVCDVVHVLDQGTLIASGPPQEVAVDPRVVGAYLGRAVTR